MSVVGVLVMAAAMTFAGSDVREDWEFRRGATGAWSRVCIPHDATEEVRPQLSMDLGDHGYVEGGVFQYRKAMPTPPGLPSGTRLSLRFDGVYFDSSVSVNGCPAGGRRSGYLPFEVELDPSRPTNVIEVTVDDRTPNTRWNPGAGILRSVSLKARRGFTLEPENVFVRVVSADAARAELAVSVDDAELLVPAGGRIVIEKPHLWSPEDPHLQDIRIVARGRNGEEDELVLPYGIRTFSFTKDRGFLLNGRHYPIRGVCQHEGEPCFGAKLNVAALEYGMREMKKLGVNAIRTAHHPFPPEFYDLCDRLGFLVMDELFDQWREPKTQHGQSEFFEAEWRRDVETAVRRDRNHPSVVLWSIGNEIPELGAGQYGGRHGHDGAKTALEMRDLIRTFDPTRPITAGLNGPKWAEDNGILPALDVCGLNYNPEFFDLFRGKYALVGSETAATYSLRDVYCYRTNGAELVIASHDGNLAGAHSMIPVWGVPEQGQEATLKRQMSAPWSAGEFTWCSFDYLGEGSNPLSRGMDHWPAVGSSWGMYDFAGLPKDRAYLYAAMWTDRPMAHLLPDWTLPGCEGKKVPVWCYTNAEEAELFLNGVSQGVRRRVDTTDLHLAWTVIYAPGVLRVEARRGGKTVATDERRTAGRKASIRKTVLFERGDEILVRYDAVDREGNRVIACEDEIELDGSFGELLAAANGSPLETIARRATRRQLFRGSLAAWYRRRPAARRPDSGSVLGMMNVAHRGLWREANLQPEISGKGTVKSVDMLPGENWWGLDNNFGREMPFTARTKLSFDLRKDNYSHQAQSVLVSDMGRAIWCPEPVGVSFADGKIRLESDDAEITLVEKAGKDLASAYRSASRNWFPPTGEEPDMLYFSAPQYNTWIELTYHQNEKDILSYAQSMLDHGMPPGIFMIDDTWQHGYGTWEFDARRFSNPAGMIAKLHAMGYKVLLWMCPFVSMDSPEFRRIQFGKNPDDVKGWPVKGGFLASSEKPAWNGVPPAACVNWWNGFSALLDFTHPNAVAWFTEQLDRLQRDYCVDGFKFDGGGVHFYAGTVGTEGASPATFAHDRTKSPVAQSALYGEFALKYKGSEYRNGFGFGGKPVIMRLHDKAHTWEALGRLIPDMLAAGFVGCPFICPDMVGGGEWSTFIPGAPFSQELFIRSAQVQALCPMMQISASPWRYLDTDHQKIFADVVRLRQKFAPKFVELAKESAKSGEPIMRNLEYVFPAHGYADIKDEFMMGETLLVAPQISKGAAMRTVVLPPGVWQADDGQVYDGGRTIVVSTPLARLPFFIRNKTK